MVTPVASSPPYFPLPLTADAMGLVALGGELTPEVLEEAYSKGLFPWTGEHPIPWYCPEPRAVLLPRRLHVSRSLRRSLRRHAFRITFDERFDSVIRACATMPRAHEEGTWITPNVIDAYSEMHRRGVAHSVEIYVQDELVGGLYGLSWGAAFFGESMFARVAGASKVALWALCRQLAAWEFAFVDCQVVAPHLMHMGATAIPRQHYLRALAAALAHPTRVGRWELRTGILEPPALSG